MRRWIILSLAIVALSALIPILLANLPDEGSNASPVKFPVAETEKANPGKALVEGERRYDFGSLSTFSEGEREWTIKNVGTGDLTLKSGASSCFCTVANFMMPDGVTVNREASLVLKPGESTPLKVSWKTKDKPGKFGQRVTVLTSDPSLPEIEFNVSGMIYPPLVTMPADAIFDFGSIDNGEPQHGSLAVASYDTPDFKITEIVRSNPDLILPPEIQPLTEEEQKRTGFTGGYRVDVTLSPTDTLGEFAEELTIKTDHPKMPELTVPMRGKRIGPISVAPERINLKASSARGGKINLLLLVREQEATNFQVAHTPPNLQVSIEPLDDSTSGEAAKVRRYRLTVEVPPGTPAGASDLNRPDDVILTTDHPRARSITIPTSFVIMSE